MLSTEERIEVVGRAADGEEAVELARRLRPDVVALDISMPVMDGFEAAEALERFDDPPAILMLTGSNAPADIDRARRVGAKGYITKDAIAAQPRRRDPRRCALATLPACFPSPPSSRSSSPWRSSR